MRVPLVPTRHQLFITEPIRGIEPHHPLARIHERGVTEVREADSNAPVSAGLVDVGKELRPSYRGGRVVLFVEAVDGDGPRSGEPRWRALELT